MPRNAEENVYVTIAFSRDSLIWEHLQKEAAMLDISVAYLIKVLLADRAAALEGHGKQLWFPREEEKAQAEPLSPLQRDVSLQPAKDETVRSAAAASAAKYWGD